MVPRRGGRNGGVIVKSPTSEVALTEHAEANNVYAVKEASPQRREVTHEKQVAEKPKASEEIVIEEISIDGMCGVY